MNCPWPLRPRYWSPSIRHGAAGDDRVDLAVDLEPLPRGVVHVHVVLGLVADGGVRVRVPHEHVGVGAWRDRALLRVHPEHPRRRRGAGLDPALERQLALHHALVDQLHPVLDAAHAVRDLGEVAQAELLLVLHAERAMVGGDRPPARSCAGPSTGRRGGGGDRGPSGSAVSTPTWRPRSPAWRASPRASGRGTAGRSRRTR